MNKKEFMAKLDLESGVVLSVNLCGKFFKALGYARIFKCLTLNRA